MGGLQTLPDLTLKFTSNCCNGQNEDDMDGSKKSRKFSWRRKFNESSTKNKETDKKVVIGSISVESQQTNVEKISDKSI